MRLNEKDMVSVVVPVYNRASMVARTLDSIKAQTWRPLELVVVDNNSTDSTLASLNKWKAANETPDFRVIVTTEQKRGASAARNKGFDSSTAPKVVFFDSDDIMYPCMIEEGMRAFRFTDGESKSGKGVSGLKMVHWRHDRQNIDGTITCSHYSGTELLEYHLIHAIFCTPNYMVTREYFETHGRWNESLLQWDDYELGVRLLLGLEGDPDAVTGVDRPMFKVIIHKESITGDDFSSRSGRWERVLDVIAGDIRKSGSPQHDRWLRLVTYRRYILAALYAREGRGELLRPEDIVEDTRLSFMQRMAMRFAYHYTASGLRGAFRIVKWFLR